jgi:uncharacterized protein YjbI with pentapeptide repeats
MQRSEWGYIDDWPDYPRRRDHAVKILREGLHSWNSWIRRHEKDKIFEPKFEAIPPARAYLGEAQLQRFDLSRHDLERIDLVRADLRGAALINASLVDSHAEYADFSGAIARNTDFAITFLTGAKFDGADCRWARFFGGILEGVSFADADLTFASFDSVRFAGTSFRNARLDRTTFTDCDFTGALDLDSCQHLGPSNLDTSTLFRGGRMISHQFLRQAGVPEQLVTYLDAMTAEPIQFYSCFISHSTADQDFAKRLYADLQAAGVRCWFAPEDMAIGDRIRDRIDQSIRVYDKLLVVLSSNSINSRWVEDEVEAALDKERSLSSSGRVSVLFPVDIDGTINQTTTAWANSIRRTRHIGDFTRWKEHDAYQNALSRLLRDLKSA